MASDSTKEVEAARKRVDKLNEQIAAEKAKASQAVAENEDAVRAAALNAEADRLEAELAAIKASSSKSAIKEQANAAVASIEESGGPVSAEPVKES